MRRSSMRFRILHKLDNRIRFTCGRYTFNKNQAYAFREFLEKQPGICKATVSYRTGSVTVHYEKVTEEEVIRYVSRFDYNLLKKNENYPFCDNVNEEFVVTLSKRVLFRYLVNPFLPNIVKTFIVYKEVIKFVDKGIKSLFVDKKMGVEVLDAAALCCAIAQNAIPTASSIMFLLSVNEDIEEWSTKKSKSDLASGLSLNIDKIWIKDGNQEIHIPAAKVKVDDIVIVRSGFLIPVDGTIVLGEAMVNQSTMTGEPLPVQRTIGHTVYAGTVVEDGYLEVRTKANNADTRLKKIVNMIDESEKYKSNLQKNTEQIADKIVPFSFLGALAVYAFTRSLSRASAVLLVDYSCAIKLSGSISVLSALREATTNKMFVKGGRYLELFAKADTIVFDKTGTLTVARPFVKGILAFGGYSENEVLKISACLEEHFPHSVAMAVVKEAEKRGINHIEEHSKVEYVVAHGIASSLGDKKVAIGSRHFIFEDEKVTANDEDMQTVDNAISTESSLYLAIDGKLAGVLLIDDPVRKSAKITVERLYKAGFKNVIMLTGDADAKAKSVAKELGIKAYKSQLLPEDKAKYIQQLKSEGNIVVMVGDGVNDTPALSAASVGVSMKNSSDIAKEVSDIAMLTPDLNELVVLKKLSKGLIRRINRNYNFIVSFNTVLLLLSTTQVITPSNSAVWHNSSTVAVGAYSLTNILPRKIYV